MPDAGPAPDATGRGGLNRGGLSLVRSRRRNLAIACVSAAIFLYYWALLTDGAFFAAEPVRYGLTFNSMIDYLAHGRFDVDPSIILHEGFLRDGRTYSYFGVTPALLRLPLLFLPQFRDIDFTTFSCAIAATLGAIVKL